MASKEDYCRRILNTYSLIIDFDGEPSRENVPGPLNDKDETYGQWKQRVLGDDITNVVLYAPDTPANQTRISTLQTKANAGHLGAVFKEFIREKNKQKQSEVTAAKDEMFENYEYVPKHLFLDLIDKLDGTLEDSVRNLLDNILREAGPKIDAMNIIEQLLIACNNNAHTFRRNNEK
jgi:hypothetical protein